MPRDVPWLGELDRVNAVGIVETEPLLRTTFRRGDYSRICRCSSDHQQQMTKPQHAMQSRWPTASLCSMRWNEMSAAVAGPATNGDRDGHRHRTEAFETASAAE